MASKLQNGAAICNGTVVTAAFQPLGVMLGNPQVELARAGSADVVMDDPIARAQGVAEHDERLDVRFAGALVAADVADEVLGGHVGERIGKLAARAVASHLARRCWGRRTHLSDRHRRLAADCLLGGSQ